MANSKVGNYQLSFIADGFTAPIRSHEINFYVIPTTTPEVGELAENIDLQLLGGGTATLQATALEIANRLKPLYQNFVPFQSFTLWRFVTEFQRDFVSAGDVAPTAISGGGAAIAQQVTLTYRSAGGAVMKQVFLECSFTGDQKTTLVPNAAGDSLQRFAAYTLSNASPFIAIDNTFPVSPLNQSRGQNEKAWRKVYRG